MFLFSQFWPNRTAYLGVNSAGVNIDFPTVTGGAAAYLARDRGIYGFGMDGPTPDIGFPSYAHRNLSTKGTYIVENLHNLEFVPVTGARAIVCPFKLAGAGASAARVFAVFA